MGDTAREPLLAVVVKGGHAPFSKRPGPLVAVLSGAIAPGDEVEVVGRSGVVAARVHDADTLGLLSDDGVVSFVERRLHRALGVHTSPFAMENDLLAAAAAVETIGSVEDADRLRVAAAGAASAAR